MVLLVIYAALRLFWASMLPLLGAEAYYWEWSQNLAWGYFDHPPMIAGLLAASTGIGSDSVFSVRFIPTLLGLLSTIFVYRLGKEMFGALTAVIACAVLQFIPFFVGASALATPDAPLLFFWVLTVYCLYRATHFGDSRWWFASGIALGLGLMSKYHAILLVPAAFLYLLSSPQLRLWLFRKEPYIAVALALLVFSPNLVWNLSRGLQTFEFLLVERHSAPEVSFEHVLHFFGGILLLLSPFFALVLLGSVPALVRKAWNDSRYALLMTTALFPIGFFGILSPFVSIGGHWPAVGYTTFCLAGIAHLRESGPAPFGKLLRPTPLLSIGFATVLALAIYIGLIVAVYAPTLHHVAEDSKKESRFQKTLGSLHEELLGWKEIGAEAERKIAAMPNPERTFIVADTYRLASQMRFLTHSKYPTQITGIASPHQYALWQNRIDLTGWDAVFISKKSRKKNTIALEAIFERVDPVQEFWVTARDIPLRPFYFQHCYTAKFSPGTQNPIANKPNSPQEIEIPRREPESRDEQLTQKVSSPIHKGLP